MWVNKLPDSPKAWQEYIALVTAKMILGKVPPSAITEANQQYDRWKERMRRENRGQ